MPCRESKAAFSLKRREALQIGVGLFGLNLPTFLEAAGSIPSAKRDISCIFLFLAGGPSHFETFDPKPDAPAEIRGLWNPIRTKVPGTMICEKLPLMARHMDKVALIRSWQGKNGSHDIGSQHVMSGMYPPTGANISPTSAALFRRSAGAVLPAYHRTSVSPWPLDIRTRQATSAPRMRPSTSKAIRPIRC
jgi:hypothetical protein